jgi:hypothetical protein
MPTPITINTYTYEELSPKAQERARTDFAESYDYDADEAMATMEALCKALGVTFTHYEIDWVNGYVHEARFDDPYRSDDAVEYGDPGLVAIVAALGDVDPETGRGLGDCKLTGMCFDEDALDPVRAAVKVGETDRARLCRFALEALVKTTAADFDYQTSHEGMVERTDGESLYLESGALSPF